MYTNPDRTKGNQIILVRSVGGNNRTLRSPRKRESSKLHIVEDSSRKSSVQRGGSSIDAIAKSGSPKREGKRHHTQRSHQEEGQGASDNHAHVRSDHGDSAHRSSPVDGVAIKMSNGLNLKHAQKNTPIN